jgi:predicted PurR-regulated permease PerM
VFYARLDAGAGVVREDTRRVALVLPLRTVVLVLAVAAVAAAFVSIRDTFLIVFVGVFLALVFEVPLRTFMRRTGLSRGKAATIVVLGTAVLVTVLALFLLVPLAKAVGEFLQELPQTVSDLRESDELSWLGDTSAAENVQDGADDLGATIPDSVGALLGVAGNAFSAGLAAFTIIFLCLFLLTDMERLRNALSSVLMPDASNRWLGVWERITESVSRWAIGAIIIAAIAGTVQGGTAGLLGSEYWLALGLIAGLLDLIPNIGATIAGFILVPAVYAEEGLTKALIMLAVVLVYQQVENNLLTPTIYGKAVNISAFFVILGVTIFGALMGVLGALVAVPLMASLQIVVQEITTERRAQVAAARAATETPPTEDLDNTVTPAIRAP